MTVPVGDAVANEPKSFPALENVWPAARWERLAARCADAAVVFVWWVLASSGTVGALGAGVAFCCTVALLLTKAQTPGEALMGLAALDVQTGQPAGAAAFVKILLQMSFIVLTLGLGLIVILITTGGALRRNVADRATGIFVASQRAESLTRRRAASSDAQESPSQDRWAQALKQARWAGPVGTEQLPVATTSASRVASDVVAPDEVERQGGAAIELNQTGLWVRAGGPVELRRSVDSQRIALQPGQAELLGDGDTVIIGDTSLTVRSARQSEQ